MLNKSQSKPKEEEIEIEAYAEPVTAFNKTAKAAPDDTFEESLPQYDVGDRVEAQWIELAEDGEKRCHTTPAICPFFCF